jgi:membrane-bound lytic murein transglycosylase A
MRRSSGTASAAFALGAALLLALGLSACGPRTTPEEEKPPARLTLEPSSFDRLPGWARDDHAAALPAFARSCRKLQALPPDRPLGPAGTAGDWAAPCASAASVPAGDAQAARAFFETWFLPWTAGDGTGTEGLFTGYYEARLNGSLAPSEIYRFPLHRRPPELVMVDLGEFRDTLKGERIAGRVVDGRLRPYEDRARIEDGALNGRDLELLWVDDPVDAFFLQIQGSGRVVLDDGRELRVGYDGQNGHPYYAIGRELVARGTLERDEVSMQSIRAWLETNPAEAAKVMNLNPSYVFFRVLDGEGPVGAQGVALTPGRSLAVDRSFIPYGVPLWLEAEDPLDPGTRFSRLMVAQDTGGAIRGPVRGDVFWGHGEEAELRAGRMRSRGSYHLLLPRTVTPPGREASPAS